MNHDRTLTTSADSWLRANLPDAPVFLFCPDRLAGTAAAFLAGFPGTVSYAVKANPDPALLEGLVAAGITVFDVASPAEMALVRGISPEAVLHYHNPVRSRDEVAEGLRFGCVSWSVDRAGELAKLLDIVREHAAAKSKKLNLPLYDALMDAYAPGMSVADVDAAFDDVAAFMPGFLNDVLAAQKDVQPLAGPFDIQKQQQLCQQVAGMLGFDPKWGRLDISVHPFSSGHGHDVRVTTRYKEEDFADSLQGVAHEVGHGLYDRYTPAQWHHQPVGASQNMGMAIHESQSLSLDMQLGRSLEYWQYLAPHVQKTFGGSGDVWSAENMYRNVTRVSRSFIRVEADEVTYPAHVILRYRLEKAMVEGKLEVKDLPDAWRAEMESLIGIAPPDDRRGCLQDIHWYMGAFGYFPSYALGAFIAAQFAHKMKQDVPDVMQQVAGGNIAAFTGWLRGNVQEKGCLYTPPALIEQVTGEKMSTRFFKQHVTDRYLNAA